jgi:hypothetical protein
VGNAFYLQNKNFIKIRAEETRRVSFGATLFFSQRKGGCFFCQAGSFYEESAERVFMKYTTLGKTGLRVSVVGLGGIPIQRTDVEGTRKVIDACIETGINYIDTARGYTVSEEYLGAVLEGRREKFVIATKTM